MVDIDRIRRLHDAVTRECGRYSFDETLCALALTTACVLDVAPLSERAKILEVFVAQIKRSLDQIGKRDDPLRGGVTPMN